jgi:hypothetical protein
MKRLLVPALAMAVSGALFVVHGRRERERAAAEAAEAVRAADAARAAEAAAAAAAAKAAAPEPPKPPPPQDLPDAEAAPVPDAPGTAAITRVYGVVYNLVTKKPVGNAKLSFTDDAGMGWYTSTDARGHYVVDLPLGSLQKEARLSAAADGYRPGQLEDADPPLRELPIDQRKRRADETLDSDLSPVRVPEAPGRAVQYDLVLLPRGVGPDGTVGR